MRYAAVIFDLFGTLVHPLDAQEYDRVSAQMAAVLAAPEPDLVRLWKETFDERFRGVFPTTQANLAHICRAFGVIPEAERLDAAARIRLDYVQRTLAPRDDAVAALTRLKAAGCKIGLISDCSAEAPALWGETPFAALIESPVFSCKVGLRKPDPRIYHLACERLGVRPQDCLYVGDGASRELSGAAQVGMHPVLIRDVDAAGAYRVDAEDWDGAAISTLGEVLALVQ